MLVTVAICALIVVVCLLGAIGGIALLDMLDTRPRPGPPDSEASPWSR